MSSHKASFPCDSKLNYYNLCDIYLVIPSLRQFNSLRTVCLFSVELVGRLHQESPKMMSFVNQIMLVTIRMLLPGKICVSWKLLFHTHVLFDED